MKWYEKLWDMWLMTVGVSGLISLGMLWLVLPAAAYSALVAQSCITSVIFSFLTVMQFIAIYQIKD